MTRSNSSSWSEGANCGPELWQRICRTETMAHHIGLFMCLRKKGSRSKEKHEKPRAEISELI